MRSATRLATAALLSAGALALVGAAPAPAADAGLTGSVVPGGTLGPDAFSAPDDAVWSFEAMRGSIPLTVTRMPADGTDARTATYAPAAEDPASGGLAPERRSRPRPLADGTVGVVVAFGVGYHTRDVQLLRIDRSGAVTARSSLPQPARRSTAFALAQDGTVWWERECQNELYRRLPDGSTRLFRLKRLRVCSAGAPTVVVGVDGSAWMVQTCRRRIVRVTPDGRAREWRTRLRDCQQNELYDPIAPTVTPRADGGIAFASSAFRGTVDGRGRLREQATRSADRPDPGYRDSSVAGRGGSVWTVRTTATYDYGNRYGGYIYSQPKVLLRAADGDGGELALAPLLGPAFEISYAPARGLLGPDGALWVGFGGERPGNGVVRVVPAALPEAAAPTATLVAATGRERRGQTVELACAADLGRWCRGTVALTGAAAASPFVVAGGQRAALRLTLGDRAARRLARGRAVRTTARVAADGAETTTAALTLR